jgi:hypothetical protein
LIFYLSFVFSIAKFFINWFYSSLKWLPLLWNCPRQMFK